MPVTTREDRRRLAIEAAIDVGGRFGIVSRQPAIIADSNNTLVHLAPSPPVAKVGTSTIRAFDSTTLEREVAVASYLAVRRAPVVHPTLRSGRKPAMFPEADAERLQTLRLVRSFTVSVKCWSQFGRAPEVDEAARYHLGLLHDWRKRLNRP